MVMMDPRAFGISEKQIKSYLKDKVKGWGTEDDPEWIANEVESIYEDLLSGVQDIDRVIEMMVMKKGWCRFAQSGQWVDIKGSGKLDNLRQACIILDQKHGIFSEGKPVQNLEVVLKAPSGKMDVKTRGTWGINDTDIKRWLRYGGNPNKLPKEKKLERQDVTKARMSGRHSPGHDEWGPVKGRGSKKWRKIYAHKLPSFKDFIVELASPYETNPLIKKALKKYDDPVKFLLNMMHLVPKLPRMGKKNTLELVKVWNDNKSKKINAALVEQVLLERPAKLSATFPYKGAEWKDFRGLENPTEREIVTLMKKAKFKEVRFVVDSKGKMWAWDTDDALHDEVIFGQTGQKYNGDYAKGMINFMTQHDLDDLNPDTSAIGKTNVVVLNTRTVGTDYALKNRTMKALAKKINAKGKDRVYWSDV
jgi:hypothetical protein